MKLLTINYNKYCLCNKRWINDYLFMNNPCKTGSAQCQPKKRWEQLKLKHPILHCTSQLLFLQPHVYGFHLFSAYFPPIFHTFCVDPVLQVSTTYQAVATGHIFVNWMAVVNFKFVVRLIPVNFIAWRKVLCYRVLLLKVSVTHTQHKTLAECCAEAERERERERELWASCFWQAEQNVNSRFN